MEEKPHDIFTILRQEPGQTDVILKFGLASPVAIILWHVIGSFFLPMLAVAPVTAALIFIYGAVIAFLPGRMFHG